MYKDTGDELVCIYEYHTCLGRIRRDLTITGDGHY
jgi:hypothetical protein